MEIEIPQGDEISGVFKTYRWYSLMLLGVLVGTSICMLGMEMLPGWGQVTGPVLSMLWCLGLALWSLRAIRSHESKFGIATVIGIMTVLAVGFSGFANRFIAMTIICLAMVLDLGVKRNNNKTALTYVSRTIQVVAGISGIAHACRIIYYVLLN